MTVHIRNSMCCDVNRVKLVFRREYSNIGIPVFAHSIIRGVIFFSLAHYLLQKNLAIQNLFRQTD